MHRAIERCGPAIGAALALVLGPVSLLAAPPDASEAPASATASQPAGDPTAPPAMPAAPEPAASVAPNDLADSTALRLVEPGWTLRARRGAPRLVLRPSGGPRPLGAGFTLRF